MSIGLHESRSESPESCRTETFASQSEAVGMFPSCCMLKMFHWVSKGTEL